MGNKMNMNDFVGAGFRRLPENMLEQHPPRVKWGQLYRKMSDLDKILYLERVASAMNHAAFLIQGERDALTVLCGQKDERVKKISSAMAANSEMLQFQVTRMNADKQQWVEETARIKAELREAKARLAEYEGR